MASSIYQGGNIIGTGIKLLNLFVKFGDFGIHNQIRSSIGCWLLLLQKDYSPYTV